MLYYLFCVVLIQLPSTSKAYPAFYIRLPNGDRVPHVCPPRSSNPSSQLWPAIGHWRSRGGDGTKHSLNPFGRDFAANRFQWTKQLCEGDSDQDGKTNGEELGDPECTWSQSSLTPPSGNATSHPGICEPIDSTPCAPINSPLATECPNHIEPMKQEEGPDNDQLACPPIKAGHVRKLELRLTGGPAEVDMSADAQKDVVHFCQVFTLPSDQIYHIIAMTPSTSQSDPFFISHVTLHACMDQVDAFNLAAIGGLNEPTKSACQLLKPCTKLIGAWKFDVQAKAPIVCFTPLAGLRFGADRYSKIVVDFHYAFKWSHPNSSLSVIDVSNSGITLFYTPKLRRYDLGTLLLGENGIRIPPRQPDYNVTVNLTNECLAKLITQDHTMTPVQATLHSNKIFQTSQLSILPFGQYSGQDLAATDRNECMDQPYYVTKISNTLIRSMDALRLTCTYDSEDLEGFTFFGPPPDGELCLATLSFYPADNATWFIDATQMGSLDACKTTLSLYSTTDPPIVNNCPFQNFAMKYQDTIRDLRLACDTKMFPPENCPNECKTLIVREELLGHDCLVGDIFQKIVRTPELIPTSVPFTPFEALSTAGTIDICRMEIYTVVMEKTGMKEKLNKTLNNDYFFLPPPKCGACRLVFNFCLGTTIFLAFFNLST